MSSGELINHNWGTPVHFEDDEYDYSTEEFHEENSIRAHYDGLRGTRIEQVLAERQATRAALKRASDELVDDTVRTPWESKRDKTESEDA